MSVRTKAIMLIFIVASVLYMPVWVSFLTDGKGVFSTPEYVTYYYPYSTAFSNSDSILTHEDVKKVISSKDFDKYDILSVQFSGKRKPFSTWCYKYLGVGGLSTDINDLSDVKVNIDKHTAVLEGQYKVEKVILDGINAYKIEDKYFLSSRGTELETLVGRSGTVCIKYDKDDKSKIMSKYTIDTCTY